MIAAGCAEHGISDAHIAGGRVHQGHAGFEMALHFGRLDDVQSGPVFDGTTGVKPFGFGKELDLLW